MVEALEAGGGCNGDWGGGSVEFWILEGRLALAAEDKAAAGVSPGKRPGGWSCLSTLRPVSCLTVQSVC